MIHDLPLNMFINLQNQKMNQKSKIKHNQDDFSEKKKQRNGIGEKKQTFWPLSIYLTA